MSRPYAKHAEAVPSHWMAWALAGLIVGALIGGMLGAAAWDWLT